MIIYSLAYHQDPTSFPCVQFLFLLIFHLYYLIFLIDLNTKVLPLDDYAFIFLLPEYCL